MPKKSLRAFFEKYIEGTPEKGMVPDAIFLLTNELAITTRSLKHLYDRKPAEEFDCLIDGLDEIVRNAVQLYENKSGRRGSYCLVGIYQGHEYICSLEAVDSALHVATAFRKRDEKYLATCVLLWSREVGDPPSQPVKHEHPQ